MISLLNLSKTSVIRTKLINTEKHQDSMEKLRVNKNKIFAGEREVILRGVSIPDCYWLNEKENQTVEGVIAKIKELGFNAVRIPVLPGHFAFYDDYVEKVISKVVELCKRHQLYCIIDWHAIGNPIHNEARLKQYHHLKDGKETYWYCPDKDLAKKGLARLSKKFGGEDHVIFEIFNEPAPGDKPIPKIGLSALPFEEWRKIALELVIEIRKSSSNLVIVSPTFWAFNLKEILQAPILDVPNIAYSFHCYPIKQNQTWREMLDAAKNFPVIVTEFGYDADEKSKYNASYETYLKPFMSYLKENKISWVGWCFSTSWRPRIVKTWAPFRLSEFGENLLLEVH